MSKSDTIINSEKKLEDMEIIEIKSTISSLKRYEPIQYVFMETEFYGNSFFSISGSLIPRPETEELVEWVLKRVDSNESINILDIGTGSGCIAISFAKNLPNAKVYALDISAKALKTAKQNADLNEVNVEFIEADILKNGDGLLGADVKFDIIVSNPPYVREQEKDMMKPNVLDNEPHLALFVKDENPLLFYEAITKYASKNLAREGHLFFEINEYLGSDMINLLQDNNFRNIEVKQDIFKKDRMIKGVKR